MCLLSTDISYFSAVDNICLMQAFSYLIFSLCLKIILKISVDNLLLIKDNVLIIKSDSIPFFLDKIYDCKIQGTGAYGFSGSFKFDFPTTSTTFDVAIQILDTPQINSIQQLTTYLRTTCGVGSKCKLRSLVFSEVPSLEAEDIHDLYSDFVDM